MEKNYTTARFVFGTISMLGWIVLLFAPAWLFIFSVIASVMVIPATTAGILAALVQAVFGLGLIATGQLGLAQIAIANNTSAILALMQGSEAQASAKPSTPAKKPNMPPARKDPWVTKPGEK